MAVIQKGKVSELIRQSDETLKQFADGTLEATIKFKCAFDKRVSFLPKVLQEHPDFPSLKLYEFGGEREPGNIWRYDCIYKGFNAGVDLWALMQEDVTVTTSQEPVETFWKFSYPWENPPVNNIVLAQIKAAIEANVTDITTLAGWPKWDSESGKPIWVAITTGTPAWELWNLLRRGVTSYRMLSISARLSYCTAATKLPPEEFVLRVGTARDGLTNTTALSKATTVPQPSKRNYLFAGLNWTKQGGVIRYVEEHSLSGPNKWNPYLYAPATQ